MLTDGNKTIISVPIFLPTSPFRLMGDQTVHEDSNNRTCFRYKYKLSTFFFAKHIYMYRLKIAGMDQVSFGPVPALIAVKIIWSIGHAKG